MNVKIERIFEIDILRFVAAIAVIFYHTTFRGQFYNLYSFEFSFLSSITKYAFVGVDLFFMISGFVILMSVQNKNSLAFVKSRVTRLYPSFWFGVSFTAFICLLWGHEIFMPTFKQYILNMTMLSGFFGIKDIDGVYWTLYIEIQFYIFIFLIMFFKKIHNLVLFLYVWLFISAVELFFYIPWTIKNILILNWSHYFIAGALFFLIRKDGIKKTYLALLTLAYIVAIIRLNGRSESMSNTYTTPFSFEILSIIVTVFFIIMALVSLKKVNINKNKKLYIILGSLSYPMYLLHHHVGFIYMSITEPYMNKYFILTTLTFFIISISYIVTIYERWMIKKITACLK